MITTPKARFLLQKDFVKQHRDITATAAFQAASDAAMLELVAGLDASPEPNGSIAAHHFLMGARHYARLLSSIAEAPAPAPSRGRGDNLNQY